jgi:hypothetical protein
MMSAPAVLANDISSRPNILRIHFRAYKFTKTILSI